MSNNYTHEENILNAVKVADFVLLRDGGSMWLYNEASKSGFLVNDDTAVAIELTIGKTDG